MDSVLYRPSVEYTDVLFAFVPKKLSEVSVSHVSRLEEAGLVDTHTASFSDSREVVFTEANREMFEGLPKIGFKIRQTMMR
jgi:hypothetical protein